MLHCQGCHLEHGEGFPGKVPRMTDVVGRFLYSDAGRRFLIQVPGVAFARLDDRRVARLMNWMLREFSAATLPADFRPYTADEVGALRRQPEPDPLRRRRDILARLAEPDHGAAQPSSAGR
ncbi:MAG: hypothetical protein D6727_01415 [Gammaproteobacteria bacterium]|nr:MAG: hypothetical protein D6727_01415 [Gammaproteobacteria bacterium]